ncbi:two component system sensor kinase [Streptomyces sp. SPB074]|nr:two component system sensor kinase [Streptomyces sp. SPB074]
MSYGLAVSTPETAPSPRQAPPPSAPHRPVPGREPWVQWALTAAVVVSGAPDDPADGVRRPGPRGRGPLRTELRGAARARPAPRQGPAARRAPLALARRPRGGGPDRRERCRYGIPLRLLPLRPHRLPAADPAGPPPRARLRTAQRRGPGPARRARARRGALARRPEHRRTGLVMGMLNRVQHQAVDAALSAAESGERAARAEAQAAVLAERGRIARDVHDVLAHSLAGINMQLELADALLDTGDLAKVRAANDKAHSLVKESLQQAQWTVHALSEDALPLVDTLTAMLESSGHRDALTVTGTPVEAPAQVTRNLLRIGQESLTNAARHAPGGAVRVELAFTASSTALTIRNGPASRTVKAATGSGMGLIGMRERVALLGGTLTAGPVTEGPDEGGWHVEAVIPR